MVFIVSLVCIVNGATLTIAGTVKDATTGLFLSGVFVNVTRADGSQFGTATTIAGGSWSITADVQGQILTATYTLTNYIQSSSSSVTVPGTQHSSYNRSVVWFQKFRISLFFLLFSRLSIHLFFPQSCKH